MSLMCYLNLSIGQKHNKTYVGSRLRSYIVMEIKQTYLEKNIQL